MTSRFKHREPRSVPLDRVEFEPEPEGQDLELLPLEPRLTERRFRWAGLFFSALAALIALSAGLAVSNLIVALFERSDLLGWIGTACLAIAGASALIVIIRELLGLIALKRLVEIHDDAGRAILERDREAAARVVDALRRIYNGRPDLRWGLDQLQEHADAMMAADDRIKLAERDLMALLDENALGLIARAARRVTLLTAVTPAAALDIVFVAALNLRMLREVATLYGGRPGALGTLKLARMVISHLAVTGGLALTDNLVQHVIGRGLLGRLSARFGEGAVNGILTARIGLAALDLCRPLPFLTRAKPSLSLFVRQLLSPGSRPDRTSD
jgi:putative membrane protein